MKKKYNIKEVADMLNISKSTLRYWDAEHLIRMDRNEINDYREYTMQQIVDISDIAFYRSINIPITKLKKIYEMNLEEFDHILDETQNDVENQISELKRKKKGIISKKENIRELERLLLEPYTTSVPDMESIVTFDISHFVELEPYDFAIVISPDNNDTLQYGSIISKPLNTDDILWKHCINTKYIQCLLRISVENSDENNIKEHLDYIKSKGYKPGKIIGRYLITATETIRCEFYKIWIEIMDC